MIEQEAIQFEILINGLLNDQYGICEDFINLNIIAGLRENLFNYQRKGEMHPAGIGKNSDFQKNILVRGDLIKWIHHDSIDIFERHLLDKINRFVVYLNSTCYTAINASEFHYATYEVNSFYKRHLDQFKSEKGRQFSIVIYLNEDWKNTDNGSISLYINELKTDSVLPTEGKTIFFKSDELEHEVHPSLTRNRISIAGWLKNI